jgi:hypothetical protein
MAKKEFEGTKGRWYLQEKTDAYTHIIRCDNGKGFETLYIGSASHNPTETSRKDAQLMAASLDLLEALQGIIDYEERMRKKGEPCIGDGHLSKAYDAVSKALRK